MAMRNEELYELIAQKTPDVTVRRRAVSHPISDSWASIVVAIEEQAAALQFEHVGEDADRAIIRFRLRGRHQAQLQDAATLIGLARHFERRGIIVSVDDGLVYLAIPVPVAHVGLDRHWRPHP